MKKVRVNTGLRAETVELYAREYFFAFEIISANNAKVREIIFKDNPFNISPRIRRKLRSGELKEPITPLVTCLAFSLELYLKALLVKLTGECPRGHDLKCLFGMFDEPVKRGIIQGCCDIDPELNFDNVGKFIERIATGYVDWRYAYEEQSQTYMINFGAILVKSLQQMLKNPA